MNNLKIKERRNKDICVLDLSGRLKIGEGNIQLHKAIRILFNEGKNEILLNLAKVSEIDADGIGGLIAEFVAAKNQSGCLKLLHLTRRNRDLMILTKLLTIFENYENEPEAIESFRSFVTPGIGFKTNQPTKAAGCY